MAGVQSLADMPRVGLADRDPVPAGRWKCFSFTQPHLGVPPERDKGKHTGSSPLLPETLAVLLPPSLSYIPMATG